MKKDTDSSVLETQCLSMENKINYYKKSLQILDEIKKTPTKPRLLLHACCGPCSTYPLKFLCEYFDVTIFFNNSNIYPSEEYYRRLDELKKFLGYFEQDFGYHVEVVVVPYDNETYMKDLEPFKDQPEGQTRCFICYEKRLNQAYKYADSNGFDYVTTVMTISRFKNAQKLNEIGQKLSEKYKNAKYFLSDFKKAGGMEEARQMRIRYNLYNQQYCGCKYSLENRAQNFKK